MADDDPREAAEMMARCTIEPPVLETRAGKASVEELAQVQRYYDSLSHQMTIFNNWAPHPATERGVAAARAAMEALTAISFCQFILRNGGGDVQTAGKMAATAMMSLYVARRG